MSEADAQAGSVDLSGANQFFILGVGRSGTSLLRSILSEHPQIDVPGETHFLVPLWRLRWIWWPLGPALQRTALLKLAFANGALRRSNFDASRMDSALRLPAIRPQNPREALVALFEAMRVSRGVDILGDKTPTYADHAPLLLKLFPASKFVEIRRDPVEVCASLRRQPWGPNSLDAAAWFYRRGIAACDRAKHDDPTRFVAIAYEDLVESPSDCLELVCSHLGVPFDPAMLNFWQHGDDHQRVHRWPDSHTQLAAPVQAGAAIGSGDLTPEEHAAVGTLVSAGDTGAASSFVRLRKAQSKYWLYRLRGIPPRLRSAIRFVLG